MLDITAFREDLISAFPSEETLPPGLAVASDSVEGDAAECVRSFNGLAWREMAYDFVRNNRHCINFITKESAWSLVPAFLAASLEEFSSVQTDNPSLDVTEYCLDLLSFVTPISLNKEPSENTRQQLHIISQYLETVGERLWFDEGVVFKVTRASNHLSRF